MNNFLYGTVFRLGGCWCHGPLTERFRDVGALKRIAACRSGPISVILLIWRWGVLMGLISYSGIVEISVGTRKCTCGWCMGWTYIFKQVHETLTLEQAQISWYEMQNSRWSPLLCCSTPSPIVALLGFYELDEHVERRYLSAVNQGHVKKQESSELSWCIPYQSTTDAMNLKRPYHSSPSHRKTKKMPDRCAIYVQSRTPPKSQPATREEYITRNKS